jgi:hypothetical protein
VPEKPSNPVNIEKAEAPSNIDLLRFNLGRVNYVAS